MVIVEKNIKKVMAFLVALLMAASILGLVSQTKANALISVQPVSKITFTENTGLLALYKPIANLQVRVYEKPDLIALSSAKKLVFNGKTNSAGAIFVALKPGVNYVVESAETSKYFSKKVNVKGSSKPLSLQIKVDRAQLSAL